MELFEAQEIDVEAGAQGRNRGIVLGQVGIRCRHVSRCLKPCSSCVNKYSIRIDPHPQPALATSAPTCTLVEEPSHRHSILPN